MIKPLLIAGALLAGSHVLAAPRPDYFEGIVRNHCRPLNTAVRCINYKDGQTTVLFAYAGDGFKTIFRLNWQLWEQYAPQFDLDGFRSVTREDILERKKERIMMAQAVCEGTMYGCGIAVVRLPMFYPTMILGVSCVIGTKYCVLRTDDELKKIDKELDSIQSGSSPGPSSSGGSAPAPAQPAPSLPPLPNGIVTINDNPNKKNIP
jgi:hypothetical protein